MTKWKFRGWAITMAVGLFAWLAPAQAWAACTSSDRAGTWQVYLMLMDDVDAGWTKCTVKVRSSGAVRSGTGCTVKMAGSGAQSASVQGGTINLSRACKVTGNIKAGGCKSTIKEGWLSRDKIMMSGVGTDCNGLVFQINGVKR